MKWQAGTNEEKNDRFLNEEAGLRMGAQLEQKAKTHRDLFPRSGTVQCPVSSRGLLYQLFSGTKPSA